MSTFKKLFASVAAAALLVTQGMTAVVYGATMSDPEFDKALSWMHENGLTKFNDVDAFRPYDTLTREQAAKFFSEFAKKELGVKEGDSECTFSDIDSGDASLREAVVSSCKLGLFGGSNGNFYPTKPLTKAAALTVLVRAKLGKKLAEDVTPWWANYFNEAKKLGFTKENDVNAIDRSVTRYEVALMLYRASAASKTDSSTDTDTDTDIGKIIGEIIKDGDTDTDTDTDKPTDTSTDKDTDVDTDTDTDIPSNVEGSVLEVTLDPDTPRDQFVPGTGTNIRVMKFDLSAGEADVAVKGLIVRRTGLSKNENIKNIYITDEDGNVITNQRSLGSDDRANMVFIGGSYVIKAKTTKKLYVSADIQNSKSEIFKFEVESVDADTTVKGEFPITSYMVQTTDYASETITVEGNSATIPSASKTLYVGETNKQVARFTMTAGSANKKDVIIRTIRLKLSKTVSEYLDNLVLKVGGEDISEKVIREGKYATFNLGTDGYRVKYGTTKTVYVYADVIGGEANDVIGFELKESSDFNAVEDETNAAVNVTISKAYLERYNVQEGNNLITRASESPTTQSIPNDQEDIDVLVANVSFSNAMNVSKMKVTFQTGGATNIGDMLRSVSLVIDDEVIDTDTSDANFQAGYAIFNVYKDFKGTQKVIIRIDTESSAPEGSYIQNVLLDGIAFAYDDLTFVSSNNSASSSDIDGSATSAKFTVTTPAVSDITRTDGLSDGEKIIKGATETTVLKFSVQANNVRDLVVNTMNFALSGGLDTSSVSNLNVVVDGETIGIDNFSDGTASLTSLGLRIPKGASKEITVKADVAASYTSSTFKMNATFNTGDIEDAKGNNADLPSVRSISSVQFTMSSGGSLIVRRDSDTPKEQVVAANANTEVEVARFIMKAIDDDVQVQELLVVNTNTGEFNGKYNTYSGTLYTSDNDNAIVKEIQIWDTKGNKLATSSLAAGLAHFNLTSYINLEKDVETELIFKIRPNSINDVQLTNKTVRLGIVTEGSEGTKKSKFVSKASNTELSSVIVDSAVAFPQYLKKTIISLADVSKSSSTLDNGAFDAYRFKVGVNASNSAKVSEFRIDFTLTDNASEGTGFYISSDDADFALYKGNDRFKDSDVDFQVFTGQCKTVNSAKLTKYIVSVNENGSAVSRISPALAALTGYTLADGQTDQTYTSNDYCIRAIMTGSYVNGYDLSAGKETEFKFEFTAQSATKSDSITLRMNDLGSTHTLDGFNNTLTGGAAAGYPTAIVWSDNADNNVTYATADWFTDSYVETLPLPSWTFSKP